LKTTRQNADALTLIEVVAALVLVATSVTALLAAQGRSLAQLQQARELETAATLARELITQWRLDPLVVPPSEGGFPGQPTWRWTRRVVLPSDGGASELQEVVLSIHRRDDRGVERNIASYTWLEKSSAKQN
jgi:Tfp pilus assembly protein PilV